MMDWLNSGAVILGLAISLYTVYSFVDARISRNRRRYALLQQVSAELDHFIGLALGLSGRAQQAMDLYAPHFKAGAFPAPASEADSLPHEAEATSRWLAARAKQLVDYQMPLDIDQIGAILSRRQADALFALLKERRNYLRALSTRAIDLEAFPLRPGVFKRFAVVAIVNVDPMRTRLAAFARSLAQPVPAAAPSSDPAAES
jgi:hypothetical protein